MRRAMRSRFWFSVSDIKYSLSTVYSQTQRKNHRSRDRPLQPPYGAALDALFVLGALKNGVHKNARRMNLIGIELAEVDEFFDFGDDIVNNDGHHKIKIA